VRCGIIVSIARALACVLVASSTAVTPGWAQAQATKKRAEPAPAPPASTRSPFQLGDAWIAANAETLRAVNQRIWSHPEVGLTETRAAAELTAILERAGFRIERGVAGMPTSFVATAGSGRPVIGILAEYDALPGTSQAAAAERRKREVTPENDAGHACGHSLFGVASTAAAVAAWDAARAARLPGTIRLYGTPAEETGIGKVYMARAGAFDELDAALHWHASDRNQVSYATSKCVISVKFRFEGMSAHASMSPQAGRSALDAVELMNVGVNFLREHLEEDARIHYVVTDGGGQPNVVPPTAEVWYYVRADRHADGERILARVRDIAKGAALMTTTKSVERIDSDTFELLPNRPLSELLQRQFERVGAPRFDERERAFARQTQSDLTEPPGEALVSKVLPLVESPWHMRASTDVGNVSWAVPTAGLNVACYTNGAPGHSWQIVACSGMSIGEKGMLTAARVLAGSTLELLSSPAVLAAARRDFQSRRAQTPAPASLIPDGQPPPVAIR
jgi:aminobenzoyl-glutamate utilization protein B